jgi:hypothetical protein
MNGQRKARFHLETIDQFMLRAIAALLGTTVFLLLCFPKCWPWFLWALDVRIRPPWKCIGFIVAIAESLFVVHLWPTKKQQ